MKEQGRNLGVWTGGSHIRQEIQRGMRDSRVVVRREKRHKLAQL